MKEKFYDPLLAILEQEGGARARITDPWTSQEAAKKFKLNKRIHQIVSILALPAFAEGLGAYQIADILGVRRDGVSSALSTMVESGLLRNNGSVLNGLTNCHSLRRQLVREIYNISWVSQLPPAIGFSNYSEVQERMPVVMTVGFAFSPSYEYVALIRKSHPDWQEGKLNGLGGKVEEGETPEECVAREFHEECTLSLTSGWSRFCVLTGINDAGRAWEVHFFHAMLGDYKQFAEYGAVDGASTLIGESVEVFPISRLWVNNKRGDSQRFGCLANIPWLLEMAKAHIRWDQPVIYAREVTPQTVEEADDE